MQIFTGEELNSTATIDNTVTGDWLTPYNFNYQYANPGDFVVYVNFSNQFNYAVLSYNISIISNVSNVVVYLENSPVVYR
jgi:hypothetical protein